MRPPLFFFLMITLAIQGYLWFHSNFSIGFPISVRDSIGILTGVFCKCDPLCVNRKTLVSLTVLLDIVVGLGFP